MPKEAFGGDDEGGTEEPVKKPDLDKFNLAPDANIRDIFWRIMGAYAAAKKPGVDLSRLNNDRFALMRIALSILSTPHNEEFGLSPRFITKYSMMMMLDGGWNDAFTQFLQRGSESKLGHEIEPCLKSLLKQEKYKGKISEDLGLMLRKRDSVAVALSYLVALTDVELTKAMKKELIILARGDVGENQRNAIKLVSMIKDDEDVKKSLIILLSHWDTEARLAAANILKTMKKDEEVKKAAALRAQTESVPEVKKILEGIAK